MSHTKMDIKIKKNQKTKKETNKKHLQKHRRMHIISCRFYKLGRICSPCKDFPYSGDCPHLFLSFCWPTGKFLNLFQWGHLQHVYFLFLPNSSHFIISKNSHGGKIYILQKEHVFWLQSDAFSPKHTPLGPTLLSR